MKGKNISIPCEYGLKEKLRFLCSFDYKDKHYFIAIDPEDNEYVCRQMRWSIFKGTYQLSKPISSGALSVAEGLLNKAGNNPSYYKMNGEHYKVKQIERNEKVGFRYIWQSQCSRYFSPFMMHFSFSMSFVLAIIFSLIYAFVYTKTSGIMWASTVFSNMSRKSLVFEMYAIEVIGAILIFILRDDEERDWADLYFNALIPLNLITIIGLAKVNLVARIILICLGVLLLLFKGFPVLYAVFSKNSRRNKNIRINYIFDGMYRPILICVICCMVAVNIFGIDGYTYIASTKTEYEESETIFLNYNEALDNINENVWKDLNSQQRIDTLQSICDYECANTFGCNTATVQTGYPENEYILGEYNHITNTILVNVEHMNEDSVHDVVNTLLHETRHVYQHSVINMLNDVEEKLDEEDKRLSIFQYAYSMRNNFDNYKSGTLNYEDYYGQSAEADSRTWAECETCELYDRYIYIDSLNEEETTNDSSSELKEKLQ